MTGILTDIHKIFWAAFTQCISWCVPGNFAFTGRTGAAGIERVCATVRRRAMCHVITLLALLAGLHSGVLGLSEYTALAPGLGDVPIAGGKLQYLLRTIW